MKYFELEENEYIIKKEIENYDDASFQDEVEELRKKTKIVVDASIISYFITPLYLLIWTFGAVVVTSVIVIAFGVLLETNYLYIPIGLAWAIWIFLVVIVLMERKKKKTYLLQPKILKATVIEGHETKKGYLVKYLISSDGKELEETLFLKTSTSSKKENELRIKLYQECQNRQNFLVTVYKDRKLKYYPIRLLINK